MPGHWGVGLSAGGFVVFWSFPVWHVPLRALLFTLQPSEHHPPYCLFLCATTPEKWGTQRNTVTSQKKMSWAQGHIKPVLLVEEFGSCCVLNNKICIDLLACFTSMSIIVNSHRAKDLPFFYTTKRCKRSETTWSTNRCQKVATLGFQTLPFSQTEALLPSLAVRVPLCLSSSFLLIWRPNHILYHIVCARVHLAQGKSRKSVDAFNFELF